VHGCSGRSKTNGGKKKNEGLKRSPFNMPNHEEKKNQCKKGGRSSPLSVIVKRESGKRKTKE